MNFIHFFGCIELNYRFNKDADGSLGILIARGIRGGIYLMGINPNGPAHRQTSLQPGTVQHFIVYKANWQFRCFSRNCNLWVDEIAFKYKLMLHCTCIQSQKREKRKEVEISFHPV